MWKFRCSRVSPQGSDSMSVSPIGTATSDRLGATEEAAMQPDMAYHARPCHKQTGERNN